ncbi:MSCRAMM family adhesin SdrC, partial [bacterium]|nr:MSCRAMM family adhesin SdrC [bacterium]
MSLSHLKRINNEIDILEKESDKVVSYDKYYIIRSSIDVRSEYELTDKSTSEDSDGNNSNSDDNKSSEDSDGNNSNSYDNKSSEDSDGNIEEISNNKTSNEDSSESDISIEEIAKNLLTQKPEHQPSIVYFHENEIFLLFSCLEGGHHYLNGSHHRLCSEYCSYFCNIFEGRYVVDCSIIEFDS